MNKITLNNLDINIYHEYLDNGLNVYVIPKNDVNNIYATFTTNYGSNEIEFVPLGEKKMVKVPLGIAHFLEHKMFEQEDGKDPFAFFGERGSDANANTNNFKTTYLFSGPEFFEDNMNYLLDYVQSPYFTDENVEKEKGIIEQEIKMYQDDPYTMMYERLLKNSLINNPMKDPIIGTIESVKSITKEELYTCYNTFYHPANMFVVVSGNVDPEKTIKLIEENQKKKEFEDFNKIKVKEYKEPDKIEKAKETLNLNVTIPKLCLSYKINISKIKGVSERKVKTYLSIFFDLKFGMTSLLNEELREKDIITDSLGGDAIDVKSHVFYTVCGETNRKDELLEALMNSMEDLSINEDELERKKKVYLSSLIYMTDNIFRLNHKVMNDINKYGEIIDNNYDEIKSLNIIEMRKVLNSVDFSNYNVIVVEKDN
jgi:predicted Zn-dependent peptidase